MKLLLPKVRVFGKTTLNKSNGRKPPPQRIRNRRKLVSLGLAPKACKPFALFLKEQYAVGKQASRAEHQAEMKRLSAMWKNLDAESKAPFQTKSQEQFESQRKVLLEKVYYSGPSAPHVSAADKQKFGNFTMLQRGDGCTSFAGEGSYGQVLLAWSKGHRLCAIKVFKTSDPEDLKHEALMSSRVKSGTDDPSFFPRLLAVEENAKPFPHLAFEYCGLSLGQMLSTREPLQDAMTAAAQLRTALQLLHNVDIVHLDVKPANCFWSADLKQLRLGDFGMAESREPELSKAEQIARLRHTTYVTSWYRPPELWNADIKDLPELLDWPVDVWSYSCVVHEMLTGKALFRPTEKLRVEELVAAWASNFNMLCTGLAGPSQRNGTPANRLFVRLIEVGWQKKEMLKGLALRGARKWPAFRNDSDVPKGFLA